jgi:Chlorite dismutase
MSSAGASANITRVSFIASSVVSEWRIERVHAVRGDTLASAAGLARVEGHAFVDGGSSDSAAAWTIHGVRSNERYLEREEKQRLAPIQQGLGRPASNAGALIPIRKADAWWELPQDERRAVFEARSRHIAIGARYLPAVARRLYHARDLGGPFDFLTWFEFSDADAGAFADLLGHLRETEEWQYVIREVEVRVSRDV